MTIKRWVNRRCRQPSNPKGGAAETAPSNRPSALRIAWFCLILVALAAPRVVAQTRAAESPRPGSSAETATQLSILSSRPETTGYAGHFACRTFAPAVRSLAIAISDGDAERAQQLVEQGLDINARSESSDTKGMTILHVALCHRWGEEAVALLLRLGADVSTPDPQGNAPLINAAAYHPGRDAENIKGMIGQGAVVDQPGNNGMTALMHAALRGHLDAVRVLLASGARVDQRDDDGWTALMHAARSKRQAPQVIDQLLAAGADVNARHRGGGSALMIASFYGNETIVLRLLEAGADANAKDKAGWTPLICAASGGHSNLVRLLLEARADVHIHDNLGRTALSIALARGDQAAVEALVKAGARRAPIPRGSETRTPSYRTWRPY